MTVNRFEAFYVRPLELVKAARLPARADMKYPGKAHTAFGRGVDRL